MRSLASRRARLSVLAMLGCLVAACAAPPEPTYYVLTRTTGPAGVSTTDQRTPDTVIGLRELALPLYARRTQIAVVGPGGAITLSDDHRWAEEAPRAMTRVVARALSAETGASVVIEPWPQGTDPDVRVDIDVDYFAGALGGDLRLVGEFRVVRPGSRSVAESFTIAEAAQSDGFDDLVDRHRRALEALATLVSTRLREE